MFRRDPRGFLEALGVLAVVAGALELAILVPDLHDRWREISLWRGLAVGALLLIVPLLFSRNRLALLDAAAVFCAIRLGIAGLIWLTTHRLKTPGH